ncbi:TetR/AcrR family transcriptional regulator [Leifsonia sp. fls2-241-R2A-40a]|uniref:TetR/AcrR family transcriptional regulator n=1 Tax=Leifsonia sp. fls2-241-R2A-40a TaxID=3040290 RepID=UPI00254AE56D|nr:TetR/AcrR family transcriptional regulator [Leifsonia sp. fls2-241-R2A-40a]
MAGVKRQYDGEARRARAEQVRTRIVGEAREVLLRDGYAGLTIPGVARACGVSAESVYKRFAGRAALTRAVVEESLRGIGPVAAESRSDALPAGDLKALADGWGRLTAEVAPRVAPILLLLDAAAVHDSELAELARGLADDRRTRMRQNAGRLAEAGHLPEGLSIEHATDVLLTYSSPQLYEMLVTRGEWALDEYAGFVSAGISAQFSTAQR